MRVGVLVKRCDMHEEDDNAPDDGRDESILMCGNWNVHALRRRYRAEELQEVFAKAVSSLRWDLNRKQFVTVIECRHPIYRMINGLLETLQKRKSRMDHGKFLFFYTSFRWICVAVCARVGTMRARGYVVAGIQTLTLHFSILYHFPHTTLQPVHGSHRF